MQWHPLEHMQKMCNWLQTDNHTNDPSLNLYRPDALPDTQPTVSKHWREFIVVVMQEFQTTGGSSPPCWEGRSLLFWVRGEPQARGPNAVSRVELWPLKSCLAFYSCQMASSKTCSGPSWGRACPPWHPLNPPTFQISSTKANKIYPWHYKIYPWHCSLT